MDCCLILVQRKKGHSTKNGGSSTWQSLEPSDCYQSATASLVRNMGLLPLATLLAFFWNCQKTSLKMAMPGRNCPSRSKPAGISSPPYASRSAKSRRHLVKRAQISLCQQPERAPHLFGLTLGFHPT